MAKTKDDLEAVRDIAALLEGFDNDERERIIRWVREKVGMPSSNAIPATASSYIPTTTAASPPASASAITQPTTDMRTFVAQKNPKNDKQLAAVVAYYHRFVAPPTQRKDSIGSDDLVDACRVADRERPGKAAQTLVNAFRDGFLDRAERGAYKLNSVGENLVAMVLPDGSTEGRRASLKRGAAKKSNSNGKRKKRAK